MRKVICSCCGHSYYVAKNEVTATICPRCYWEEDEKIKCAEDYSSSNRASLKEYRNNFKSLITTM